MVLKLNTFIKSEGFRIGKKKHDFMTEDEWQDLFTHIDKLLEVKFSEDWERKLDIHATSLFSNYYADEYTWRYYFDKQDRKEFNFKYKYPYSADNSKEIKAFMSIIADEYRKAGWRVWHWTNSSIEVSVPKPKILLMKLKEFFKL